MRDRNTPLTAAEAETLAWEKMGGLLPAAVQDCRSGRMLMLGYMNREALAATFTTGSATFWSRSKERLWTKGETSGNFLRVQSIHADCDRDALLIIVAAHGPTCHLGPVSCFADARLHGPGWLAELSRIVSDRATSGTEQSYTRRLLAQGPGRIAQKIGEEGVEVALAGAGASSEQCAQEAADLLYHIAVLMEARGFSWSDVVAVLQARHSAAEREK